MTFNELLQEVYAITNRPDLIPESKMAIKAATLKAHQSDFYSKDIYEQYVTLGDTAAYLWSLDYISLISNLRAFKYVRKLDPEDNPGDFITILTPEEILDTYGASKQDIAYVAGRHLEIKSSTEISTCLLAAYVNPIVQEGAYSSWVASLYPYTIVFEAARVLFKTIGYDEQSATYEKLVAEQFQLLKINATSDVAS